MEPNNNEETKKFTFPTEKEVTEVLTKLADLDRERSKHIDDYLAELQPTTTK